MLSHKNELLFMSKLQKNKVSVNYKEMLTFYLKKVSNYEINKIELILKYLM